MAMSGPGFGPTVMLVHSGGAILQTAAQQMQQQEWIPTLLTKRMMTWHYLQSCFRGGMVFYNTALVTEDDMRNAWTDDKMHRRTLQFFFLGTSLATILEIPNTADCLKALNNLLQEYETFGAAEGRSKSIFFKGNSTRKTTADGLITSDEHGEYSYLEVRNIPFALDYPITASTLCDMVLQVYEKLRSHLVDERIWSISTIESFQRIDGRFKKIVHTVYKEFEVIARETMFQELNYLIDPMASITSFTPRYDHDWEI
ncbi:hypothetical protein BGZ95_005791 [Linnemannia exigua]|uniref:Uncharacterized protein n=1 Tax=Linnemannia exigua TaxID=604196 RepID=A0AAD4H9N6_9FUNG|nr:hypothetical protein BGZ95_005791 [Linnemannia exigua]